MNDNPYDSIHQAPKPPGAPTIHWSDITVAIPLTIVAHITLTTLFAFVPYFEQFRGEFFQWALEQSGSSGLVALGIMLLLYRLPSLIILFSIFCIILRWTNQRRELARSSETND